MFQQVDVQNLKINQTYQVFGKAKIFGNSWNIPHPEMTLFESVQLKDIEKINHCLKNGYSIIHIYQKDIWNDSYDWQAILKEQIERLKTDCKAIFISSTSKYSMHIEQLDYKYEIINPI